MHNVKYRDSAMSCAIMAEPVEMQFEMLSQLGPGNVLAQETCVTWRVDAAAGISTFEGVWPIEKHCKA